MTRIGEWVIDSFSFICGLIIASFRDGITDVMADSRGPVVFASAARG
jgi:hypothetical protein